MLDAGYWIKLNIEYFYPSMFLSCPETSGFLFLVPCSSIIQVRLKFKSKPFTGL